jgi:hypothetical protein
LLVPNRDLAERSVDQHLEDRVVWLARLVQLSQEVLERGAGRSYVCTTEARRTVQRILGGGHPNSSGSFLLFARHAVRLSESWTEEASGPFDAATLRDEASLQNSPRLLAPALIEAIKAFVYAVDAINR